MATSNSNPYISKIKVPGNNTAINIEIPVSQLRDVDDGVTTERVNQLKDLKTTSTVQAQIDDKLPLAGGTITGNLTVNNQVKATSIKVTDAALIEYDTGNNCIRFVIG